MESLQIVDKIDECRLFGLFGPAFQREYVWKRRNAGAEGIVLVACLQMPHRNSRGLGEDLARRGKGCGEVQFRHGYRAILIQTENGTKSDTAAFDCLSGRSQTCPDALRRQCIPEDTGLRRMGRFEEFLEERRMVLAEGLNGVLSAIATSNLDAGAAGIDEPIAEGEHDGLEFESTLRWRFDPWAAGPDREHEILGAIFAFDDGGGGPLVIAVDCPSSD